MDEAKLNKILRDYGKRISALEISIGVSKSRKIVTDKKNTLSDHIIELRNKRFFSQPKIAQEVHKSLQSSYPCDLIRVQNELPRLVSRKQLRISSKLVSGKTYKAYVW